MATGGAPAQERRREALTCSLCLEIFTSPKLLPCSHTFCLKCLQDLTAHRQSGSFPCPQCRHEVTVPQGGVAGFQNNYYLDPEDLDKARGGTLCLIHANQELDLYCEDCQEAVCLKCVLTKHKQHTTKDLSEAAEEAKSQLKQSMIGLQEAVANMTEVVMAESKELADVQGKKAVLKTAIKKKHATLVAIVNKLRDDSLASLDSVSEQVESEVRKELESKQQALDELCQMQQLTQQTISSGTNHQLISAVKDIGRGRGSQEAVQNLTSPRRDYVCRPVLTRDMTEEAIEQHMTEFFGSIRKVQMQSAKPEVVVEKLFSCGEGDDDTEVFSLCPFDNNSTVWVSFARHESKTDAPGKKFNITGKCLVVSERLGKCSFTTRGSSSGLHTTWKEEGVVITFDKSQRKKTIFKLIDTSGSKADIKTVNVISEDPLRIEEPVLFSIRVGAHRAFDVDSSETRFVVLEEAEAPGCQRQVHLFRRDQQTAVSTYTPPTPACRPSDVCFFPLGGREVLLVSDEGTDSVHVVHVQGDDLRFDRYLAPGCPLLLQPTALCVDTEDRLWVACRGGAILRITPTAWTDSVRVHTG